MVQHATSRALRTLGLHLAPRDVALREELDRLPGVRVLVQGVVQLLYRRVDRLRRDEAHQRVRLAQARALLLGVVAGRARYAALVRVRVGVGVGVGVRVGVRVKVRVS